MENKNENVYRCPYCGKCCAVKYKNDPCIRVEIHKSEPPPRPHAVRTLTYRKCTNRFCSGRGKEFIVENYTDIDDLLLHLITNDKDRMTYKFMCHHPELVERVRNSTEYMALLLGEKR